MKSAYFAKEININYNKYSESKYSSKMGKNLPFRIIIAVNNLNSGFNLFKKILKIAKMFRISITRFSN
jgi:hypothetical protein